MAANPALDYALPDVEAHLNTILLDHTVTITLAGTEWPWPHWASRHTVRVVTRAASKQTCSDEAWAVHGKVIHCKRVPWADGHVVDVEVNGAPAWLPDPDGSPAYAAEYVITARPRSIQ